MADEEGAAKALKAMRVASEVNCYHISALGT